MARATRPHAASESSKPTRAPSAEDTRERTVSSMITAALLAVLGTLIFAWALRAPDYPWLFALGALPWSVGLVMFARALVKYTRA